jgi:hypothetical protein
LNGPGEDPASEWRRLLRGGFAFQNALFASHPRDGERARKMLFFALRDNVTPEQILSEARDYLNETVGLASISIEDQLARVEAFLGTFRLVKKKKSAWLVFWNSVPPLGEEPGREILTIMDSRKSVERIQDFLEQTYIAKEYGLREKMLYATRPKSNPYPATYHNDGGSGRAGITCGHNPWLEARFVRNLCLERGPEGHGILSWD